VHRGDRVTAPARIVAATDFSPDAGYAVSRAALLASRHRASLELLHVVSKSSLDALREWVRAPADFAERMVHDVRRLLEESAADIVRSTGIAAAARVETGDVVDVVLAHCDRADLLAVGAHGLNPLRDAILGTTVERLVGRCRRPILVARRLPAEYRNVLVPVDLLAGSANALASAAGIAPEARITVIHAYEVPFEGALARAGVSAAEIDAHRAEAFQKALDAIGKLAESAGGAAGRFLPMVERGHAARLVIDRERSLGADLIVIEKRARSPVEAMLLGSVTRHILADAGCDVLVLPGSS
jgi:nucleotide-binding universal stress UspA family protein